MTYALVKFIGGPLDGGQRIIPDEGTIQQDVIQIYLERSTSLYRHVYRSHPPHQTKLTFAGYEIKIGYTGIEDESETGTLPTSLPGSEHQE